MYFYKLDPHFRHLINLGNPDWKGGQRSLEIQVGGGIKKMLPSVVGVWIFSGITQ